MSSPPSVSVAIPQYGNHGFSMRAVEAVAASTYGGSIEIIVSDDGSPDGPGPLEKDKRITLVIASENRGFGSAVNAAAAVAEGDLLLILNNDTVLSPDCLSHLVDTMQTHEPRPGLVGPQYRTFDGEILEVGSFLDANGSGWQGFRSETLPRSFSSGPFRARYVSAAAVLVDRQSFVDLGGFDDAFAPAYYEDTDLAMRLVAKGHPVVVNPAAVAYHYEGGTSGTDISTGLKKFQETNRGTFAERWSDVLREYPPLTRSAVHTQALSLPSTRPPILWAGQHLPRLDREAGHRRIVSMIEAITAQGTPVAFWAERAFDGQRYGAALVDRGVRWFGDTTVRSELPTPHGPREINEILDFADWGAIVISYPELAERIIPTIRLQKPGLPIIVDVVDLHFLREERAVEVGATPYMSPGKSWELNIYSQADGVIGSSSLETEVLRSEIPKTPSHTFPVAVEEPTYVNGGGTELVFLGNFDHHPNLDAVDWWVKAVHPFVRELSKESIVLTVVGSGSERFMGRWPKDAVRVQGWVQNLDVVFSAARVFVVPLRYGAGTKGKIMAAVRHGTPVVTTSVGAESMPAALAPALHVVDEPEAFAETVVRFRTDDLFASEQRSRAESAAREAWIHQRVVDAEFATWIQERVRHHVVQKVRT